MQPERVARWTGIELVRKPQASKCYLGSACVIRELDIDCFRGTHRQRTVDERHQVGVPQGQAAGRRLGGTDGTEADSHQARCVDAGYLDGWTGSITSDEL